LYQMLLAIALRYNACQHTENLRHENILFLNLNLTAEVKTIYWTLYTTPVVSEMGSISISSYKGHEEVPMCILASYIEHSDNIRRQKQKMFPKHCSCCVVKQNEGQYLSSLKYQGSIVRCRSGCSQKLLLA
jgi:hypothetical protein